MPLRSISILFNRVNKSKSKSYCYLSQICFALHLAFPHSLWLNLSFVVIFSPSPTEFVGDWGIGFTDASSGAFFMLRDIIFHRFVVFMRSTQGIVKYHLTPPSAAHKRQWIRSALVQIMAYRLFSDKSFIIYTSAGLLPIRPFGTNFSKILVKIPNL